MNKQVAYAEMVFLKHQSTMETIDNEIYTFNSKSTRNYRN
jgi:hypothetical protein